MNIKNTENYNTKDLDTNNTNLDNNLDTTSDRIHILEYMKLSKKERTRHINLKSPCIPSVIKSIKIRAGEFKGPDYAKIEAAQVLSDFLGVEGKEGSGHYIHTCHTCQNDSLAPFGYVCVNPHHLYFGTAQENMSDKAPWKKRAGGLASWADLTPEQKLQRRKKMSASVKNFYYNTEEGAKLRKKQSRTSTANMERQLASGKHISQQRVTCPHCGKEGNKRIMHRWHMDNCKHNPENNQNDPQLNEN